ncbi:integrase core domain-containing protein [Mycobacterium sp.]|uniref:integrase core domain-containing protein n=1 Tax=Mycobacterium sp. TaxID=1785 RepID=UPI003C76A0F2
MAGQALDNTVSESFNSTLEFELLSRRHFLTREQARRAVAAFIDEYNTARRPPGPSPETWCKSSLDRVTLRVAV